MRLLSIDPSLRGTGFAILEENLSKIKCLEYGVIKNAPKETVPNCLHAIYTFLKSLIQKYQPEAIALESIIYVQSYSTAIVLGSVRGVILLAAAEAHLPIKEYAPKQVKQAVVGGGGALKTQVAFMVKALLGLEETPPSDAADAIAIGMTHFHASKRPLVLAKRSKKATSWKQALEQGQIQAR